MNTSIERLQKKLAGDGPAERQVLLMKLLHEFDHAPDFGSAYVADAGSEQQRWIARVGALLCRAGIEYQVSFKATRSMTAKYWTYSREELRRQLMSLAEVIKLELELEGHENIGQVYEAQRQYDFLRDLREIILGAEKEVFVVDPYFDGTSFETYLGPLGSSCTIRVLCSKYASDVEGHVQAFEAQHGIKPDLRKSRVIHDRVIIIDNTDCWIVGGSIKDAGKKPTYLVPLQPHITPTKIEIYEGIWRLSDPL